MEWIKFLNIGDTVWQIEMNKSIPNGFHKWKGKIVKIETGYIEVKWQREPTLFLEETRKEMKKGSSNNFDRTYFEQWTKNYFAPDGSINIEQYT